jgi:AcrR family transcriptional regulator
MPVDPNWAAYLRPMGRATRSTRDDWILAAYQAAGRGGVDAIAIEPIAAELGVSKGGFYYRFGDREELIAATLDHWTAEARLLMQRCNAISDSVEQLHAFLRLALADDRLRRADAWFFLHASAHPLVRPVARRAADENVAWFASVLAGAGLPAEDAARRARVCWSAYLGTVAELMASASDGDEEPIPEDVIAERADLLVELMIAPTPRRPNAAPGPDTGKTIDNETIPSRP